MTYRKIKKTVKYLSITLGSLIALLLLVVTLAVNFVLTPDKLTPLVLEQANRHLNGEVTCEAVDITVFSTFPQVGIRLTNGQLLSHAAHDSLPSTPQDSLLQFKTCLVTARPLALLASNAVKIHEILIDEATIYAYKNSEGSANWEIVAASDSVAVEDEVTNDSLAFTGKIEVGNIEIRKANVTFDDRSNQVFADLRNFNFRLSGSLSDIQNQVSLHLDTQNILVWQQGKLLVNKIGFGFDTHLFVDRSEKIYKLEDTQLDINGIRLLADGVLKKDTTTNDLAVDFNFGLQVPTLKTVLDLIPTSIVNEAVDVTANGAVDVKGSLKGVYGVGKLPVLEAIATIDRASAQYKGMVNGIDQLDLDLAVRINLQEKKDSYVKLNKFYFAGASSTLQCSGEVNNPLLDPKIDVRVDAHVNFTDLVKTFPLEEGVVLAGKIDSKLHSCLLLSDVKQENWGRLGLGGMIKLSDVEIISPRDSFEFKVASAGFGFGANREDTTLVQGKSLLNAIVGFDGFSLKTRKGVEATMNKASLQVKTSPLKDTTSIASMQAILGYGGMSLILNDSVKFYTGAAQTEVRLDPSKRNKKIARLSSTLKFDSVYAVAGANILALQVAGFDVKSEKESLESKHWISDGSVGFGNLKLFTPAFPLLMSMPASKLSFGDDAIRLNNAKIKVGSSDLQVTGSLSNLKEVFLDGETLIGKMSVASNFINCNELMRAMEMAQEGVRVTNLEEAEAETKELVSESAAANGESKLFVVPDKIDFVLDVDVKAVLFGALKIEKIKGEVVVRNRSIELSDLKLHALSADMNTTLVYSTKDTLSAYTGFDLRMKDIQVGKLVEFIPALDSIVPMLRSLDGFVNFQIAAEARLDSTMSLELPSLQAATKLRGDSLVLMDGETFSEISKMLHFKNKSRNVIDSVSVDVIVKDGQINIYPFLIGVDRYLVAVGGKHNIDMSFDYHVSLLKSPIPFSAGVDISGNLDDFKFKITRAKYKDMKNSVRVSPVDSASISVRSRIKEVLREKVKAIDLKRKVPASHFE
ncbi:MAG: AsmA-like C-terminal region-containing protein [Phocaeicola sp.]